MQESYYTCLYQTEHTVWCVKHTVTEFNLRCCSENETLLADSWMRNKNEIIKSTIWQQNLIFPTSDIVNGNRRVCWYLSKEHLLSQMKITSLQNRNQSWRQVHKDTMWVFEAEGSGKKNHYWRMFSETAVEDAYYIWKPVVICHVKYNN